MIPETPDVPRFDRKLFDPAQRISRIGTGSLGGKARGLVAAARILSERRADLALEGVALDVPALCVLATSVFDAFLDRNGLRDVLAEEPSDQAVALAFQRADLARGVAGGSPLRRRRRSGAARLPLLERARRRARAAVRRRLRDQDDPRQPARRDRALQEPGRRRQVRVRLDLLPRGARLPARRRGAAASRRRWPSSCRRSSVASTVSASTPTSPGWRAPGTSTPWGPPSRARASSISPSAWARRSWTAASAGRSPPPTRSCRRPSDRCATSLDPRSRSSGPSTSARRRRTTRWRRRSSSCERGLADAEADGTLRHSASTYDVGSDRLVAGIGRPGPRVLDFAPILAWNELPLVPALRRLLAVCQEELEAPVEIEFALSLPHGTARPPRLPAGPPARRLGGGGRGRGAGAPGTDDGRGLDGRARQRPARGAGRRLRRARAASRRGSRR